MADFYPILARAVAGLPDTSSQARQAVYERARAALLAQLRSLNPPLSEAEIMRERLSLDEAAARVEADYGEVATPEPEPILPDLPEALPPVEAPEPAESAYPAQHQEPQPQPEPVLAARDPFAPPEETTLRPRVLPPRDRRIDPGHVRTAIVGGGIAIAIAAIAGAAYYVNKVRPPEIAAPVEAPAAPPQPETAGKINDRVGEPAPGTQAQAPARAPQAGQPAQPGVAVAQRAILYTEQPNNPQQPQAVNGRVFWRLDSESAGQGRPVETIVRATIEVADAGLTLDFTIRRNAEAAFPASHLIGMRFARSGSFAGDSIKEVGVPQFKTDESERGAPLSAISSALGDNLFVSALSNVPVEVERNIDLMQNRNWIDIPVMFSSGRRGIVTFEKGFSGAQTLSDALIRWR